MRALSCRALALILTAAVLFSGGSLAYAEDSGWAEKLSHVEGVTGVEKIPVDASAGYFYEKYLVTFSQPLDWNDPDAGAFPQRVVIGLREGAEMTVLETNGYTLTDQYPGAGPAALAMDDAPEIARLLGADYVNVEHRFFGGSRPADMSNDDIRYWEQHTAENAAKDYHRIFLALSPLLGERWAAVGSSRGGEMTNVYAFFYPEDMVFFASYVAPCSMGPEDPRFYPFLNEKIGDDVFGPEKAAEMRDTVTAFQVELMRYKQILLPVFETAARDMMGCVYREQVRMEQLYDLNVLEFGVQFWQTQRLGIDDMSRILDLPDTTPGEAAAKAQAAFGVMMQLQTPMDWAVNFIAWPYYVNAATTYGQYRYDFSRLRGALEAAGLEGALSVAEDMEDGFLWEMVFTPEQRAAFVYDGRFAGDLAASVDTTEAKILMVFGASDPWISLRLPDTDNPNVAVFIHPSASHTALLSTMPEDMRREAYRIIEDWTR